MRPRLVLFLRIWAVIVAATCGLYTVYIGATTRDGLVFAAGLLAVSVVFDFLPAIFGYKRRGHGDVQIIDHIPEGWHPHIVCKDCQHVYCLLKDREQSHPPCTCDCRTEASHQLMRESAGEMLEQWKD